MARTQKNHAGIDDFALMEKAAQNLADGVDPIEVFKHAPQFAFDPMTEFIAEAYRRHQARHPEEYRKYLAERTARLRKAQGARP